MKYLFILFSLKETYDIIMMRYKSLRIGARNRNIPKRKKMLWNSKLRISMNFALSDARYEMKMLQCFFRGWKVKNSMCRPIRNEECEIFSVWCKKMQKHSFPYKMSAAMFFWETVQIFVFCESVHIFPFDLFCFRHQMNMVNNFF